MRFSPERCLLILGLGCCCFPLLIVRGDLGEGQDYTDAPGLHGCILLGARAGYGVMCELESGAMVARFSDAYYGFVHCINASEVFATIQISPSGFAPINNGIRMRFFVDGCNRARRWYFSTARAHGEVAKFLGSAPGRWRGSGRFGFRDILRRMWSTFFLRRVGRFSCCLACLLFTLAILLLSFLSVRRKSA